MLSSSQHQRALRGLLMLKETYNLSVEDLLSGRLRLRSPAADEGGVSERDFSSCHSLTVHDLVDLAGTAVMDGWIDDAVELTRAGVRLIEKGDLVSSFFLKKMSSSLFCFNFVAAKITIEETTAAKTLLAAKEQ